MTLNNIKNQNRSECYRDNLYQFKEVQSRTQWQGRRREGWPTATEEEQRRALNIRNGESVPKTPSQMDIALWCYKWVDGMVSG